MTAADTIVDLRLGGVAMPASGDAGEWLCRRVAEGAGSSRLELTLIDRTREKYTWKKIYNDPGQAAAILKTALGDRLSA